MTDYLTLAEFKNYTKILSVDGIDDTLVADIISGASRYIDKLTGRRFYGSTETHYLTTPLSGNDRRVLYLDDDLITMTTLTNGDGVVIASTQYDLFPLNKSPKYAIRLKNSSVYSWTVTAAGDAIGAITAAGSWGYSATAPADIKTACYELAVAAYRRKSTIGNGQAAGATMPSGIVIQPEDVSKTVMQILRGYMRAL